MQAVSVLCSCVVYYDFPWLQVPSSVQPPCGFSVFCIWCDLTGQQEERTENKLMKLDSAYRMDSDSKVSFFRYLSRFSFIHFSPSLFLFKVMCVSQGAMWSGSKVGSTHLNIYICKTLLGFLVPLISAAMALAGGWVPCWHPQTVAGSSCLGSYFSGWSGVLGLWTNSAPQTPLRLGRNFFLFSNLGCTLQIVDKKLSPIATIFAQMSLPIFFVP